VISAVISFVVLAIANRRSGLTAYRTLPELCSIKIAPLTLNDGGALASAAAGRIADPHAALKAARKRRRSVRWLTA
jgi:hypothetical protein